MRGRLHPVLGHQLVEVVRLGAAAQDHRCSSEDLRCHVSHGIYCRGARQGGHPVIEVVPLRVLVLQPLGRINGREGLHRVDAMKSRKTYIGCETRRITTGNKDEDNDL